jgi:hypothetical protein
MRALRRFERRLTSWARTSRDEERLRAEIDEHIALLTAENERAGMSPAEARRQAILQFGGVESMKEEYRDQRGLPFLETLLQDTRHALRRLRKAPAFTFTAVVTLALGIGATTSIFTLVHAVLLKSLAVSNPNQLLRLGKETRWSRTSCICISATTRPSSPNSPDFRPARGSSASVVKAAARRRRAIPPSMSPAITSACSESAASQAAC